VPLGRLDQGPELAEPEHRFLEQLAIGEVDSARSPPIMRSGAVLGPGCWVDPSAGLLCHGADSRLRCPTMEVRLAGGVLIDVATAGDVKTQGDRLAKLLERPHARFLRQNNGKVPRAANAPFCISLGRPPQGMLWKVQWLIITGDDPTVATAIANVRAALFAGAMPPDSQLSGSAPIIGQDFAGVLQHGIAVPSTITIPDMSVVYSNEELYVVIGGTGTVAGAGNYHVSAGLLEMPQTAEALTW
jgi:hypothetical protein